MRCCQVEDLLSAYIDEELESAERQAVLEHLEECENCSKILDRLLAFDNILEMPQVFDAPPELVKKLDLALSEKFTEERVSGSVININKSHQQKRSRRTRLERLLVRTSMIAAIGVLLVLMSMIALAAAPSELRQRVKNEINRAINYLPRPNYFAPPMKGQEASVFEDEDVKRAREAMESGKTIKTVKGADGRQKILSVYDPETGVLDYIAISRIREVVIAEDLEKVESAYKAGKTIIVEEVVGEETGYNLRLKIKSIRDKAGNIEYEEIPNSNNGPSQNSK